MSDNIPSHLIPLIGYRDRKAAQMCAFLALKNATGMIEKLKLIKLIYLTEREFLSRYHTSALFDELYSLPHGPICSSTLNGINGAFGGDSIWAEFLARNGNVVVATRNFGRDQLDELSEAEIECLEDVWSAHGSKTTSQIRNWTHENCAEYTEIEAGRIPITYEEVLRALGEAEDGAQQVEHEIQQLRRAESVLA